MKSHLQVIYSAQLSAISAETTGEAPVLCYSVTDENHDRVESANLGWLDTNTSSNRRFSRSRPLANCTDWQLVSCFSFKSAYQAAPLRKRLRSTFVLPACVVTIAELIREDDAKRFPDCDRSGAMMNGLYNCFVLPETLLQAARDAVGTRERAADDPVDPVVQAAMDHVIPLIFRTMNIEFEEV